MAIINVDIKDGPYGSGIYEIGVKKESFDESDLFEKLIYTITSSIKFPFFKIKGKGFNEIVYKYHNISSDPLKSVDVYFSKYTNDKALVFGINTQNGRSIYYKFSDLVTGKSGFNFLPGNSIHENRLTNELININNVINNKITFIVNNKHSYNNIHVTRTQLSEFIKYSHLPTMPKYNVSNTLYNNLIFNVKTNAKVDRLENVQNKRFDNIAVYFNSNDDVPLLVEFYDNSKYTKYYYSRSNKYDLYWTQITFNHRDLKQKLKEIQNNLEQSIIVLLQKKQNYKKAQIECNEDHSTLKVNEFIKVGRNPKTKSAYESFEHDISAYSLSTSSDRLKLIISNKKIETYRGSVLVPLEYINTKKVNVYIHDTLPLLVEYNGLWFVPESKNTYFNKWICCELPVISDDYFHEKIVKKLDEINYILNEIHVNKDNSYGIYEEYPFPKEKLDTKTICVSSEESDVFKIFKHKTKNNFGFNNVYYLNNNRMLQKIWFKGNSAVIYYYKNDINLKYPLLVNLLTYGKKHMYYVLKNGGSGLEQYINTFKDQNLNNTGGFRKIIDHQNFLLNRVTTIKLDKKELYTCCDNLDKNFIKFYRSDKFDYEFCYINTKLPGRKSRPPEKFPLVYVEMIRQNVVLNTKKYRAYKHTLGCFIRNDPEGGKLEIIGTGQKSETSCITIKYFGIRDELIKLRYNYQNIHQLLVSTKVVYVYFFDKDPRPLLFHYDGLTYVPPDIRLYLDEWIHVETIINHCKINDNCDTLLDKLYEVCYCLNPVKIHKKTTYQIHREFSNEIKINVDKGLTNSFKYYTHTAQNGFKLGEIVYKHNNIKYKLFTSYDEYDYKTKELISVTVYYYNCDEQNEYPVLIHLKFNDLTSAYYQIGQVDPQYIWNRLDLRDNVVEEPLSKLQNSDLDLKIKGCIRRTQEKTSCSIDKLNNYRNKRGDQELVQELSQSCENGPKGDEEPLSKSPQGHNSLNSLHFNTERIEDAFQDSPVKQASPSGVLPEVQSSKDKVQTQLVQQNDNGTLITTTIEQPLINTYSQSEVATHLETGRQDGDAISNKPYDESSNRNIVIGPDTVKLASPSNKLQQTVSGTNTENHQLSTLGYQTFVDGSNSTQPELTEGVVTPNDIKPSQEESQPIKEAQLEFKYQGQQQQETQTPPGSTDRISANDKPGDNTGHLGGKNNSPDDREEALQDVVQSKLKSEQSEGSQVHLVTHRETNYEGNLPEGEGTSSKGTRLSEETNPLTYYGGTDQEIEKHQLIGRRSQGFELHQILHPNHNSHDTDKRSLSENDQTDIKQKESDLDKYPPSKDDSNWNNCKWISSGVAGLGVVSCASYLAYKYREMIPVRDMRAIF